jgi:hypothetical protein
MFAVPYLFYYSFIMLIALPVYKFSEKRITNLTTWESYIVIIFATLAFIGWGHVGYDYRNYLGMFEETPILTKYDWKNIFNKPEAFFFLVYVSPNRIGRKLYKIPFIKYVWDVLRKDRGVYNTGGLSLTEHAINRRPKTAVYQAVLGNYDVLQPAFPLFPDIYDCFLFTDSPAGAMNWKVREIPEAAARLSNPVLINRYLKMHPHELFPDYDYTMYLDGNIQLISDPRPLLLKASSAAGLAMHRHFMRDCLYNEADSCIRTRRGNVKPLLKQIKRYKDEGFPKHFGLFECGLIITSIHNKTSKSILSSWWKEFYDSGSMRDQISLPYTLWKHNLSSNDIDTFGVPLYKNPKIMLRFRKRDYK